MNLLSLTQVLAHPAATDGIDVDIDIATGLGGSAVGTALTTVLVGAVLIALAPNYVQRMTADIEAEPIESFVYGIMMLVALVLLTFALILTILGILLAIPLIFLAVIIWGVGSVIGFLVIGERLLGVDSADDWLRPLAVGAAINGALTLTGIGGLVSFCIGAAGVGAILRDWLGDSPEI
jgi:hypothetical protein